jgi:hypothetical protein
MGKTNTDQDDAESIVRVIQRDDFALWYDPRAEDRIKKFNDHDEFYIEGIGITFWGRDFKSRAFREMVLDNIRQNQSREDHQRRCYPSTRDVQIYLARDHPRVYLMSTRFEPAREFAEELGMPVEDYTRYVLCLYTGALFKRDHERYEQFKN